MSSSEEFSTEENADNDGESTEAPKLTAELFRQIAPAIVMSDRARCHSCNHKVRTGRVGHKLNCGHLFHYFCLLRSLLRSFQCPVCGHRPTDPVENQNVAEEPEQISSSSTDEEEHELDPRDARIPLLRLEKCLTKTLVSEKVFCVVCQRNLKPGEVGEKLNNCNHIFHYPCIANHYRKRSHSHRCPVCRSEIAPPPEDAE